MVSVVTEKRQLENGDCSSDISQPKYKKRKVSAVREFPPGCGPNATPINFQTKEVEDFGKMMGDTSKNNESSGRKEGDLHAVDEKGFLKVIVESQSDDIHVYPSSGNGKSSSEEAKNVENVSKELPVDMRSYGLLKDEPLFPQESMKTEEKSESKNDIRGPAEDLMDVGVESPSVPNNTSAFDLQEAGTSVKSVMLDEEISLHISSLPHYPIPSSSVWKEQKYPPRKRVSAVRDFPTRCGRNMQLTSETENKRMGFDVTNGNTNKEVFKNDEDQSERYLDVVSGIRNTAEGGASKKSGDELEGQVEVVKGTSPEGNMLEENFKVKGGEHHLKLTERVECDGEVVGEVGNSRDEVNKELIVYVKDKHKKSSIGVSYENNELLAESLVDSENEEDVLVVQALMASSNNSVRKRKKAVRFTPSMTSIKQSEGKKPDYGREDEAKFSPNKSKESTKNLGGSSKMIIPCVEETETKKVSNVGKDEGDLSENDESLDDFQLVPRKRDSDVTLPPFGTGLSTDRDARHRVREILRLFNGIARKLQQGDESKSKDQENTNKRVDLRASNILKAHGKLVNLGKKSVVGPVPGVEVGDIFNFRIELSIIGLHRPPQAGIDYAKQGQKIIATSIVASGGYANDVDSSDVLIYAGQGGNATGGDKQPEDQKLERGNLALKNSVDEKNFVRVIRGLKETKPSDKTAKKTKTNATYTYDGLYTVEKCWHDIGPHGKLVYKFELRRVPGQPELAWKEVKRSKKFKEREGRCVLDISESKETFAISAINTIDDEKPPPFTYITEMMYPDWCQPIPPKGCDCKVGCTDSKRCACAVKNGGEIPYNHNGAIVEVKPLVYECGPSCSCPSTCYNRVSQYGIKFPLEIFKTDTRGWGVRSLSAIPSGSFICEYIGELLDNKEAEQRTGKDEYLFDIGQNYSDPTLGDGLSELMPDMASSSTSTEVVENVGFTIDAAMFGNIGRFINHSCTPNLYAQNVLYDHGDKRIPHIMLFAAENIPPLQELTYHYNYTIDQVSDRDGNIKKKSCYCGSSECTHRMY